MKKGNLHLLENAEVYPLHGSMDAFQAGVFAEDGLVQSSLLYRTAVPSRSSTQDSLPGTYIFGGYLFGHFGHFVLESLSRAYAFALCKKYPILFSTPNDRMYQWQKLIFDYLKIDNDIVIIDRPTTVEKLVMSECGCTLSPAYISAEQLDALAVTHSCREKYPEKIWISRSKFAGGGVEEEKIIEGKISQLGWTIVHPQEHAIKEQVQLISSAKHVAGFDGSAFYGALFAKSIQGKFCVFSRRDFEEKTLSYMLQRKNISFETYVLPVKWLAHQGAAARFSMTGYEELVEILLTAGGEH